MITEVVACEDTITQAATTLGLEMISPNSKRAYASDVLVFRNWLDNQNITLEKISYDVMLMYHQWLLENFSKATTGRRFTVARRLLAVALKKGLIPSNPAEDVKIKLRLDDSSAHVALSKREARRLLSSVDTSTKKGLRDYSILMLLIYGGLRRSELVSVTLADITSKQEHMVLTIRAGKGNKRGDIPLRPETFRAIKSYLEATDRLNDSPESYLFEGFLKGDKPNGHGLTDKSIELMVKEYGKRIGLTITPHDLRASFITFAIDTGSPLIQVQRLAGHNSPTTTERYYSRKQDLDTSPVYRIRLED